MEFGLNSIKEFIVITFIVIFSALIFAKQLKEKIFINKGILLVGILVFAYFSFNYFIFVFLFTFLLSYSLKNKKVIDKVEMYLFLLPFLPNGFSSVIPFPGLDQLYTLTYAALLAIIILVPIFFAHAFKSKVKLLTNPVDFFVLIYFLYWFLTNFRDVTFTNGFRVCLEMFIGSLVIYFVISRVIVTKEDFEKVAPSMVFMGFILGIVGVFQAIRHWQLFISLVNTGWGQINEREGLMRASGAMMGPIPFGVYLSVMLGVAVYLGLRFPNKKFYLWGAVTVMFFGIFATSSRGALVEALIFLVILAFSVKDMAKKIFGGLFLVSVLLLLTPFGAKIISSLPFIGHKEQGTILYRQELVENSLIVIRRNFWTGSSDYQQAPEIQALRGEGWLPGGKVDIVNTYLGITLEKGVIGLAIFLLIILAALWKILQTILRSRDQTASLLAKIIFALTIALLLTIYTVSFINLIPIYFWILIGLCAGYEGRSVPEPVLNKNIKI